MNHKLEISTTELFNKFFINYKKIAVAVSGGADSIALCLLLSRWAKENHIELFAITVDHALRSESMKEAQQVQQWLQAKEIQHEILTWQHEGVTTRIQEKARNVRYQLMSDFCKKNDINVLCTGHHLNDQLETFFMRLSKGSGPEGLCCMQEIQHKNDIAVIRPFINVAGCELKQYLTDINHPYIEDPSNQNTHFERVRWRQLISPLLESELSLENFSKTIKRMQTLNAWIEESVEDATLDIALFEDDQIILDLPGLIQLHPALSIRLLNDVLQKMHPTPYPVAYDKLEEVVSSLTAFKTTCLGGCVLTKKGSKIVITLDPRIKNDKD